MLLNIPYDRLKLIDYESCGNKTPVLDLNPVSEIRNFPPEQVRKSLENDLQFRRWLSTIGKRHQADTVMAFYTSQTESFDIVTFICEPNAPVTSRFSEMCGNGIRSLAWHYSLQIDPNSVVKRNKIKIWSGDIKQTDILSPQGIVQVTLGQFQNQKNLTARFISGLIENNLNQFTCPVPDLAHFFSFNNFGFGFHGQKVGEPHLVYICRDSELKKIAQKLNISSDKDIFSQLRRVVTQLGRYFTFDKSFPEGVNFSIAVVKKGQLYISTHERNLELNLKRCLKSIRQSGTCRCNTLACGTAGAVCAEIAVRQGHIKSIQIKTIHPGGEITYYLDTSTKMVGKVTKLSSS